MASAAEREWHMDFEAGLALSPDMAGVPGATSRIALGHDFKDWLGLDVQLGWSRFGTLIINEGGGLATETSSHRIMAAGLVRLSPPPFITSKLAGFIPFFSTGPAMQINLDSAAALQDRQTGFLGGTRSRRVVAGGTWDLNAGILWRFSGPLSIGLSGHIGVPLGSSSRWDGGLSAVVAWWWSL